MKKSFNYKNHEFIIMVDLDIYIERTPNGLRYHRLTISDIGPANIYFKLDNISTDKLEDAIDELIECVKNQVDKKTPLLSKAELILTKLGFE